jgi:general secretion pathway protein L
MDTLLIRILSQPPGQTELSAQWLVLDHNRLPMGQGEHGPLSDATPLVPNRRVVILVPAEDTLLTAVRIKARNRQQLLQAVPYALEEDLADDVEQLHFALGPRSEEDDYPVAVVARSRMETWLEALRSATIHPDVLAPELLALPTETGEWTVVMEAQRALVRTDRDLGFACEPDNLPILLAHALDETETPAQTLHIHRCGAEEPPDLPSGLALVEAQACPPSLFATGLGRPPINLLQGPYRVESKLAAWLRPWRWVAVLAGGWLALSAVDLAVDYRHLARQDQAVRTRIEQVFRESFPQVQRIVNPRVQMEQQLRTLKSSAQTSDGSDLMVLLDASGRAITSASGVHLDTILYRNARLEIALTASDFQAVEQVKQRLQGAGLRAEIVSADRSGQRVDARLLVQRGTG